MLLSKTNIARRWFIVFPRYCLLPDCPWGNYLTPGFEVELNPDSGRCVNVSVVNAPRCMHVTCELQATQPPTQANVLVRPFEWPALKIVTATTRCTTHCCFSSAGHVEVTMCSAMTANGAKCQQQKQHQHPRNQWCALGWQFKAAPSLISPILACPPLFRAIQYRFIRGKTFGNFIKLVVIRMTERKLLIPIYPYIPLYIWINLPN